MAAVCNGAPTRGNQPTGGETPTRGNPPTGGETPTRGNPPTGGETPTRGNPPTGGETPTRGNPPTGGETPTRGNPPTGGKTPTGGEARARSETPGWRHLDGDTWMETPARGVSTLGCLAPPQHVETPLAGVFNGRHLRCAGPGPDTPLTLLPLSLSNKS